jgi:hypothetical protein
MHGRRARQEGECYPNSWFDSMWVAQLNRVLVRYQKLFGKKQKLGKMDF